MIILSTLTYRHIHIYIYKMLDIEEGGADLVPLVPPVNPNKNFSKCFCVTLYLLMICIFIALVVLYILRVY
jgi:hypothetical protein